MNACSAGTRSFFYSVTVSRDRSIQKDGHCNNSMQVVLHIDRVGIFETSNLPWDDWIQWLKRFQPSKTTVDSHRFPPSVHRPVFHRRFGLEIPSPTPTTSRQPGRSRKDMRWTTTMITRLADPAYHSRSQHQIKWKRFGNSYEHVEMLCSFKGRDIRFH